MASPQKTQKPASRWGFLQQAVASVESRLDNILAEDEEPPKKSAPAPLLGPKDNIQPNRASTEIPRSNASTPANDRLQERLARAMAKKAGSRPESPMPSSEPISRPDTPNNALALDGPENVVIPGDAVTEGSEQRSPNEEADAETAKFTVTTAPGVSAQVVAESELLVKEETPGFIGVQVTSPSSAPPSDIDPERTSSEALQDRLSLSSIRPSADSQAKDDASLVRAQIEHEATQSRMQEEINGYMERIDALQAKLQYLTKEAVESTRQAAAAAQAGSAEKKILEKEEKIALLMDEGQKLSVAEMKHLTTIKKLRQHAMATNKEQESVKVRAEKAERSLRAMEDRARRAEASNKRAEQNLASSLAATNDFEALTKERNALNVTIVDMKGQLSRANTRAEAAESKAQSEQLEREKKKTAELQDDLTSAKVERELAEEKLKREIKDLTASIEREREHSRVMETEMLGEQAALESKLESFRARAEEASSGDHGETQAKLLRQIETLQSQYAAASQNWQGIEGSLLGRITSLEKERDDIAGREGDVRKKLRDATLKAKNAQRDVEDVQNRFMDVEKSQADAEAETQRLSRKTQQLETDLVKARQDLEDQKVQAERELARRLDEEKAKWTAALHIQRVEPPTGTMRKGSGLGFDMSHMMNATSHYDRGSGTGRRSSALPGGGHDQQNTPPRLSSATSFRGLSNGSMPESPSIIQEADEYFANELPTPASNSQHASLRGVNDLISTSTVGAGPSVQLVERMSANVRRLESEKAATKDELARLTSQRDEARQEVVSLMRETEEKRKIEERLHAVEKEHQELTQRYRTTLEMLGEKSEQVDELKADVLDVKQMYRQLADTMK